MRTLPYYDQLGVAGKSFLASQCVQINAEEIALLAERGVRVTHMPLSNCEVGGGIAPIPEMLEAGVTVGLGSDGYIDDFFEVMRGAFLIHKAKHQNPQVMPAHLVWYLATEGGAKALGLEKVGRIETGWQADLQLINAYLPTPIQVHNLYEQLLLYRTAQDVSAVLVAGETKVHHGDVIGADWEMLQAHTQEAATRLWSEAK
jgi:cytosine/adenosine deaminase-related metal-dependent hydrolase